MARGIVQRVLDAVAPPPAPPGPSLTSDEASERAAAIDAERTAAEARRDRMIRDLERQIDEARTGCVEQIANAMQASADRRDELDAALVADVKRAIDPIMREAGDAPRPAAVKLADTWRAFDARCRRELGCRLCASHLAYSLVRVRGAEDEAGYHLDDSTTAQVAVACERLARAVLDNHAPSELETLLREFERVVDATIRARRRAGSGKRFAIRSSSADGRVARARLLMHDAETGDTSDGPVQRHERFEYARRMFAEAHGHPLPELTPTRGTYSPARTGSLDEFR